MGTPTEASLIFTTETEDKTIEVWEQGSRRWLEFGDRVIQTEIDLDDPRKLSLLTYRAMMAVLIFIPEPARVLLVGTGGGSIARYIQQRCPDTRGDAIECSEAVAEVARCYFEFPTESQGWRLLIGDARDYIKTASDEYDLIVVDIAEGLVTPEWIGGTDFLGYTRKRLSPKGAVVFNVLVEGEQSFKWLLQQVRQVFKRQTVCLSVPDHRNIMVLAFRGPPQYPHVDQINQRLPELEVKWGLEFGEFLVQMSKDNPASSGVL